MAHQVVAVMEALPTHLAGVRPLPAVGALVAGQVGLAQEAAVTVGAGIRPVRQVLGPGAGEEARTGITRERGGDPDICTCRRQTTVTMETPLTPSTDLNTYTITPITTDTQPATASSTLLVPSTVCGGDIQSGEICAEHCDMSKK